jgi:hypothetical protein
VTIERPKAEQLDRLLATVDKIHRAEARLASLKEQASHEARALAEIPDKNLRVQAGFYAYWFAPEVPATDIALGATGRAHPGKLIKLAGAVSVGVPCARCGEDLPIHSRNQMKEVIDLAREGQRSNARRLLCISCQNALAEESLREREMEVEADDLRRREIAAMSYAEYLRTPEFERSRDLHLWWLAEQARALECEACGADAPLGLYHKSQGDRGRYGDVILLCATCRDALLNAGKLVPPAPAGHHISPEMAHAVLETQRAELGD